MATAKAQERCLREDIVGLYENYMYTSQHQNGYHFVEITEDKKGVLTWKNLCTKWTLYPTNKPYIYKVGEDCVYHNRGYYEMSFKIEKSVVLCAYGPYNEIYHKVRHFSDNIKNMNEYKNKQKQQNNNNNNDNDNDNDYIPNDDDGNYYDESADIIDEGKDNTTDGCVEENNGNKGGKSVVNNEVLMFNGGKCKKNKMIGRISIQDNFRIEFTMVIHGRVCDTWENILHIGNSDKERSPGIWLHPKKVNKLHVRLGDINNFNTGYDPNMIFDKNVKYLLKLECVKGCVKLFINNKLKQSSDDIVHLTRYRAPVWISNPWYEAANVTIADLKIKSWN